MVSLDPALPFFDAGDLGKTLHKTAAPELSVDDDRQIVRQLFGDEIPDGLILRSAELLFVTFSSSVPSKGVLEHLRPEHAANQVNAEGFKICCSVACHDFRLSSTASYSFLSCHASKLDDADPIPVRNLRAVASSKAALPVR